MDEPEQAVAAPPTAAERRQAREQSGQRVPRHTVADLLRRPVVIGQTAAVVAAALHGHDGDKQLTAAEAEKLIAKALERRIGPESDESPDTEE